ncbi:MAG TPA: peroxiredoxin [Pyrinomonadaceae bacterium]|nr:peroxiredoxin [Pyrinomonadaceae bacterium]
MKQNRRTHSLAAVAATLAGFALGLAFLPGSGGIFSGTSAQQSQQPAARSDAGHYGASGNTAASAATTAPKVGDPAPDFRLPYATQEKIFFKAEEQMSLSSLKGKNVILAFYPADWSGGCTTEVCTFRDTFMEFGKLNAVVLGISGDYVFSHHEWAKHHKLQFPLLSDHDHRVARAYDSYMEQYGFNKRTVYLIDKDGVVRYVNPDFKAGDKKHYDALRAELEKLK